MKSDNISDAELIRDLKDNDLEAFEALYHKYKTPIASSLLRLLKSDSLTEDFLHDLFIKVWENKEKIDPERSFPSYLYRIAENMVFDFFRKAARDRKLQEKLLLNENSSYFHVEELLEEKEKKKLLDIAIKELSPQCRLVFQLCKLEGRSYEEVSKMLGISPHTISNHLTKARKQLLKKLKSEQPSMLSFFLMF